MIIGKITWKGKVKYGNISSANSYMLIILSKSKTDKLITNRATGVARKL